MVRTFSEIAAEIEASPDRRAHVDAYERAIREQILLQKPYEHRKWKNPSNREGTKDAKRGGDSK